MKSVVRIYNSLYIGSFDKSINLERPLLLRMIFERISRVSGRKKYMEKWKHGELHGGNAFPVEKKGDLNRRFGSHRIRGRDERFQGILI